MRMNLLAFILSGLVAVASSPTLPRQQGQDQESSSSSGSNSNSESSSTSPSKPNPQPSGKSSKPKNKKQHGPPQTSVVDTDTPLPPDSPEKDLQVAEYYIRKGDPDAAIPRLREAIQEKPNLARPRLMLAEIYEKKGDVPDAVRSYKEYLQVFPAAPDSKKIEKKIEKLSGQ